MDEFSLAALRSLILANQLLSVGIISFLLAAVTIYALWEKVGYFLMRVWHGVPLVGTVARLARNSDTRYLLPFLSERTAQTIAHEAPALQSGLILASPEFQWK